MVRRRLRLRHSRLRHSRRRRRCRRTPFNGIIPTVPYAFQRHFFKHEIISYSRTSVVVYSHKIIKYYLFLIKYVL